MDNIMVYLIFFILIVFLLFSQKEKFKPSNLKEYISDEEHQELVELNNQNIQYNKTNISSSPIMTIPIPFKSLTDADNKSTDPQPLPETSDVYARNCNNDEGDNYSVQGVLRSSYAINHITNTKYIPRDGQNGELSVTQQLDDKRCSDHCYHDPKCNIYTYQPKQQVCYNYQHKPGGFLDTSAVTYDTGVFINK